MDSASARFAASDGPLSRHSASTNRLLSDDTQNGRRIENPRDDHSSRSVTASSEMSRLRRPNFDFEAKAPELDYGEPLRKRKSDTIGITGDDTQPVRTIGQVQGTGSSEEQGKETDYLPRSKKPKGQEFVGSEEPADFQNQSKMIHIDAEAKPGNGSNLFQICSMR